MLPKTAIIEYNRNDLGDEEAIFITIYDIAELAGVSPSTVSRALNGKPGVSSKNRALIQAVLDKYDYIPDEAARMLGKQRSRMVGVVTDDLNSKHQNEAFARCQNELIVNGYQCIPRSIGSEPDSLEKLMAELKRRRVEGVLLFGLTFTDHEHLERVIERWLPEVPVLLVYQSERFNRENVYCIGANERKGFQHCVRHLVERGRKKLALIVEAGRASRAKIRNYFETAVQEYPDLEYRVYMDIPSGAEGGEDVVQRILKELPEVDGILCTQDRLAIEVMYALKKQEKRIPEDISLIGEGNSELCEVCRPRLTSLDTMVTVSSMMSVRILMDVMEGRSQTHKITLEMELVNRETL